MSLTEQDKADILGVLSGFGDPVSTARATHLVATDGEAAEYLRQLQIIASAFTPPEGVQRPLTRAQAAAIETGIRSRDHRGRNVRRILQPVGHFLHRKYALVAAVVLIALLPTFWLLKERRSNQATVAEAVLLPDAGYLRAGVNSSRVQVLPGTQIDTGEQLAAIRLQSGSQIDVDRETAVRVVSDDEIHLNLGAMVVHAARPIRLKVSTAHIQLTQGTMYAQAGPEQITCDVFSGAASVEMAGKTFDLPAGRRLVWHAADGTAQEVPLETSRPPLADQVQAALRKFDMTR